MNNYYTPSGPKVVIYGIVFLCAFLAMAFMARRMYHRHDPGRVNSARGDLRRSTREDLMKTAAAELSNPGWVDQAKGIVRLPVAQAMAMTVQGYQQDAMAAHSNLVARAQKAAAPAPKKPSEFE